MVSVEDESSSSEDDAETTLNDDLPRGSERDVIEYYFYRGLTYRHITLMLEKQHNIIMNQPQSTSGDAFQQHFISTVTGILRVKVIF